MSEEYLLKDPNIEPTAEIIADGLGQANKVYTKFLCDLEQQDISLMEWRYYNDSKAWLSKGEYRWTTARGANKVKPLFWLSLWQGFFKIGFFFPEKLRKELQALPISKATKEIIKSAKGMGKQMKFFGLALEINDEKQLADVYTLAQFRKDKI